MQRHVPEVEEVNEGEAIWWASWVAAESLWFGYGGRPTVKTPQRCLVKVCILGLAVRASDPSPRETEEGRSLEFEISLVCTVSCRPGRTTLLPAPSRKRSMPLSYVFVHSPENVSPPPWTPSYAPSRGFPGAPAGSSLNALRSWDGTVGQSH